MLSGQRPEAADRVLSSRAECFSVPELGEEGAAEGSPERRAAIWLERVKERHQNRCAFNWGFFPKSLSAPSGCCVGQLFASRLSIGDLLPALK